MRASATGLFVVLCVLLMGLTGGAGAQELNKKQRAEVNRFAANNSLFVLYHEMSHLLVQQLGLPVLGREEDAADNMATWILLNRHSDDANVALADSARGWQLSGLMRNTKLDDSDYYASHSLDRQRAYQIVCLMVGSDGPEFKPIANQYAIDTDRQDSCHWDYDLVDRSLRGLLGARNTKNSTGTEVNVSYQDATGKLKRAADAFRASGVFEQVADELRTHYSLSQPVRFNAQRCGEPNAFYDPNTVEIIFCYEMMQDFIDLYIGDMPVKRGVETPRINGPGREEASSS